jgi:apolipoprotein N-acyltransferase
MRMFKAFDLRSTLFGFLSGLLLVLSLPKPDFFPLAWVALVPLLVAIYTAPNLKRAFLPSYVAGVMFFAGTCYWITETMTIYGGVGTAAAIGIGLLFALTFALHVVMVGIPVWLAIQRWDAVGMLAAAPVWVTVELLRTYWVSGFPWMLFGYALVPFSGILQIVTWTGVYGLSFIAVAVNSVFAIGIAKHRFSWIAGGAAIATVLSILPIIGEKTATGDSITARLVQTNISLDQPWQDEQTSTQLLDELSHLSNATPGTVQLIVWPETPAPFYLKEDPSFRQRVEQIARASQAYVLVGYIDKTGADFTNSAGLVDPEGRLISRYDKIHLVPFGEYIPLKPLLFFAESLTRQVGDYKPGAEFTISPIQGHRFSTAICYESIFPNLVRQFVRRGSELIVVITNDGWFGESSAPFQHLRMGVARAVENRRYEVRTANTGVSAIIDPYGRIQNPTSIGRRVAIEGKVYFRSDQTFYTRYGDVFAFANAAVTGIGLATVLMRRKNVRRSH